MEKQKKMLTTSVEQKKMLTAWKTEKDAYMNNWSKVNFCIMQKPYKEI